LRAHLLGHRMRTHITVIWVGTRLVHRSNQRWPNDVCLAFYVFTASGTSSSSSTSFVVFLVLFLCFCGTVIIFDSSNSIKCFPFKIFFSQSKNVDHMSIEKYGEREEKTCQNNKSLSRTWAWLLARRPLNPQSRGATFLPARIIPRRISLCPLLKFPPQSFYVKRRRGPLCPARTEVSADSRALYLHTWWCKGTRVFCCSSIAVNTDGTQRRWTHVTENRDLGPTDRDFIGLSLILYSFLFLFISLSFEIAFLFWNTWSSFLFLIFEIFVYYLWEGEFSRRLIA